VITHPGGQKNNLATSLAILPKKNPLSSVFFLYSPTNKDVYLVDNEMSFHKFHES
jgi:hypothetical protein